MLGKSLLTDQQSLNERENGNWERLWKINKTGLGSHTTGVTVCPWTDHCLSLNFGSLFIQWDHDPCLPHSPEGKVRVRMGRKAISFKELSVHCVSSNSLCVLEQDMALSGTFSSVMLQMATKIPPGSTMASAQERLVVRGSVFPVSQLTEALTGPGPSSWPAPARDVPSQGSRLPGARKGGVEIGQT